MRHFGLLNVKQICGKTALLQKMRPLVFFYLQVYFQIELVVVVFFSVLFKVIFKSQIENKHEIKSAWICPISPNPQFLVRCFFQRFSNQSHGVVRNRSASLWLLKYCTAALRRPRSNSTLEVPVGGRSLMSCFPFPVIILSEAKRLFAPASYLTNMQSGFDLLINSRQENPKQAFQFVCFFFSFFLSPANCWAAPLQQWMGVLFRTWWTKLCLVSFGLKSNRDAAAKSVVKSLLSEQLIMREVVCGCGVFSAYGALKWNTSYG